MSSTLVLFVDVYFEINEIKIQCNEKCKITLTVFDYSYQKNKKKIELPCVNE